MQELYGKSCKILLKDIKEDLTKQRDKPSLLTAYCKGVNFPLIDLDSMQFYLESMQDFCVCVKFDKLVMWQCKGPRITTLFIKTKNKVQEIAKQDQTL